MATLVELEARFIKYVSHPPDEDHPNGWVGYHNVEMLEEADGVLFLCPLCFANNSGPIGTHSVICWFVGQVPDSVEPGPGRWNPSGTGLSDLTFVPPGAVSVWLTGSGCGWHGHVSNGSAT